MPIVKSKRIVLAVIIGIAGVCVVLFLTKVLKPPKESVPLELKVKRTLPEEPDPFHLAAVSAPDSVRRHLLDGAFEVVRRMNEIPASCTSIFESSFVNASEKGPKPVPFANPGEAFQSSDAVMPGLPFRRLEFAGLGRSRCFIHYQSGGKMYPSFCLAVVDYANHKTIWVGESQKAATSLEELRLMLLKQRFRDTSGPIC